MLKIRMYGHFGHGTGYGRAATDFACALIRHAPTLALDLWPLDEELLVREIPDEIRPSIEVGLEHPDIVIVCTLPFVAGKVLETARATGAEAAKAIAYTVWESAEISASVRDALKAFDVIWSPSMMSLASFKWVGLPGGRERSRLPVYDEPIYHCVDEALIERAAAAPFPTEAEKHRFLWIGKCVGRKNIAALLRVYVSAFSKSDPVELLLHMPGATDAQLGSLIAATGVTHDQLPGVQICNVDRPREAIDGYYTKAHTYVCAAHGEGFNFPAFDAMLYKRHVIAPEGQGSDDFLEQTTARLYNTAYEPSWLDTRPTSALREKQGIIVETLGAGGLNVFCSWQTPDLNALRFAMIEAASRRIPLSYHADYNVAEKFGYAAVAKKIVGALAAL